MPKPMISDIEDIRTILEKNKVAIFGLGEYPSSRSEIHFFANDLEIFFEKKTNETASVENLIPINYLPKDPLSTRLSAKKTDLLPRDRKLIARINKKSKNKKAAIYVYKSDYRLEKICKRHNWKLIACPADLYYKLSDKQKFHRILKKLNIATPQKIVNFSQLDTEISRLARNGHQKAVVQLLYERGGRGTFFLDSTRGKNASVQIKERMTILKSKQSLRRIAISKFIKGPALSITGCVTRDNGILSSYCQYQLIDIPEVTKNKNDASGIFCGHDWSLSNAIPEKIHKKSRVLIGKIGKELKKEGFIGLFGLDLIWEKKFDRIVPLEINPRLLGTFPTGVYVQIEKKEVPLVAFHVLDYLNIPYKINGASLYRKGSLRHGAHLILHNPEKCSIKCFNDLKGGVYNMEKRCLRYLREGIELGDLKAKNEFIITEGGPIKGKEYKRGRRLLRLITSQAISKNHGSTLNQWGKEIVTTVYKELKIKCYV